MPCNYSERTRELIHSWWPQETSWDEKQGRTKVYKSFGEDGRSTLAQITSLTKGYQFPLRWRIELGGGKMEWSQGVRASLLDEGYVVFGPRSQRLPRFVTSTRRAKWQIDVRGDRTIYSLRRDKSFLTKSCCDSGSRRSDRVASLPRLIVPQKTLRLELPSGAKTPHWLSAGSFNWRCFVFFLAVYRG